LEGILCAKGSEGSGTFLAVGFSTVQNDKYLEATASRGSFQISPESLDDHLTRIDQWGKKSRELPKQSATALLIRSRVMRNSAISSIRPSVEQKVSANAKDLLSGDEEAWKKVALEYHPMMKMIAKSLSPGFTTEATRRRREISRVAPNMWSKPEKSKKSTQDKGENM
jgi:hypothetical protein